MTCACVGDDTPADFMRGMMEKSGMGVRPPGVTDWHEHVRSNMYTPEPEPPLASKL